MATDAQESGGNERRLSLFRELLGLLKNLYALSAKHPTLRRDPSLWAKAKTKANRKARAESRRRAGQILARPGDSGYFPRRKTSPRRDISDDYVEPVYRQLDKPYATAMEQAEADRDAKGAEVRRRVFAILTALQPDITRLSGLTGDQTWRTLRLIGGGPDVVFCPLEVLHDLVGRVTPDLEGIIIRLGLDMDGAHADLSRRAWDQAYPEKTAALAPATTSGASDTAANTNHAMLLHHRAQVESEPVRKNPSWARSTLRHMKSWYGILGGVVAVIGGMGGIYLWYIEHLKNPGIWFFWLR